MFKWLRDIFSNVSKILVEPELEFVKNVCEQNNKPPIYSEWSLGYLYVFKLCFKGIRIELEYNIVRQQWDMEIWSHESNSFLFYHDCLDPKPTQSINYLIERYELLPILEKAVELKNQERAKSKKREEEVIKRYTS